MPSLYNTYAMQITTECFAFYQAVVVGDVTLSQIIPLQWLLHVFTDFHITCGLFSFNFLACFRIHSRKETDIPKLSTRVPLCHSITLLCFRANVLEWQTKKMELKPELVSTPRTGEKWKILKTENVCYAIATWTIALPFHRKLKTKRIQVFAKRNSFRLLWGFFGSHLRFRLLRSRELWTYCQYSLKSTTQNTKIHSSNEMKLFQA